MHHNDKAAIHYEDASYQFLDVSINSLISGLRQSQNWKCLGLIRKQSVFSLILDLVIRAFMYASLIVLCSGENIKTIHIVLSVGYLDGEKTKEIKRFLTRCYDTFPLSQG